ncbi:hypothetical protein [Frigoribacterium salinisoli]
MSDQDRPVEGRGREQQVGGAATATTATEPVHGPAAATQESSAEQAPPRPFAEQQQYERPYGQQYEQPYEQPYAQPYGQQPYGQPAPYGHGQPVHPGWQAAPAAGQRESVWRRRLWLLPLIVGVAALVVGLVAGGAGGFALGSTLGGGGRPGISVDGPAPGGPGGGGSPFDGDSSGE